MGGFMVERAIGIDLGTTNIRIYKRRKGVILKEPSVVAVDRETNEPVAFGLEAKRMFGRTPESISIIRPIQRGVIADFEMTEQLLNYFLKKAHVKNVFLKSKMVMNCPLKITKVEENAVREAADRLGSRDVYLVDAIKASALGSGLDISRPDGNMIIDMGGGVTDIAIISLGSIIKGDTIFITGDLFDKRIVSYMKNKYKLLIGEKTAEEIKIEASSLFGEEIVSEVRGRDLITNLPHTIEITSNDITDALQADIYELIDVIKEMLEDVHPEIAADIASKGIILTGGASQLRGLAELLSFELDIPVKLANDGANATAEGLGILLENVKSIKRK